MAERQSVQGALRIAYRCQFSTPRWLLPVLVAPSLTATRSRWRAQSCLPATVERVLHTRKDEGSDVNPPRAPFECFPTISAEGLVVEADLLPSGG
jgi:hypothetical protein